MLTKEYQKSLSEKEEAINQRTARLDSKNMITLEQVTDEEQEENDKEEGEAVDGKIKLVLTEYDINSF